MSAAGAIENAKSEIVRILLVEDDDACARLLEIMLTHYPCGAFTIRRATNLSAALQEAGRGETDLVLLDLGLPDSQGLDTFLKARARIALIAAPLAAGRRI